MKRQRLEKFQLCLTKEEKLKAAQLAQNLGTSLSAFFRSVIYKKYDVVQNRQLPEINLKTYLELGKIGNNLNQIAKVLNSHQKLKTSISYEVLFELKQEIALLKEQLANLLIQLNLILQQLQK